MTKQTHGQGTAEGVRDGIEGRNNPRCKVQALLP